jgi:hypothetical protein
MHKIITGDYQRGFRRNRRTTDHMFCIRQMLRKILKQNEAVHELFIEFEESL